MKLTDAFLCLDCNEVFGVQIVSDARCPKCCNKFSWPLARFLNKTDKKSYTSEISVTYDKKEIKNNSPEVLTNAE